MAGKNGALDLRRLADLSAHGIEFQPCALVVLDNLPYRQAERLARGIGFFHDASKWWLGDFALFADDAFGEDRIAQLMEATGRSYHTIENYRWVSSKVAIPRRRAGISHSSHAEIASLSPDEQTEWLDKTEEKGWSVRELRDALREAKKLRKQAEQPLWTDATDEPDPERVMILGRRVAREASPTGDGTYVIPGEIVVQLRALYGEPE